MRVIVQKIDRETEERVIVECYAVTEKIHDIVSFIQNINEYLEGIENGEKVRIPLSEIYYVEAVDNKTFAYLENRVIELKLRLYQFEECYQKQYFVRASKSAVINMLKLESAKPALNGRFTVTLSNGERVMITRKYVSNLRERLRGDGE
ncbi:LytTR family DNA-binding domain-containing protein [Anaerosporobacter sp.]